MKKWTALLLVLLLLGALAACSSGEKKEDTKTPESSSETQQEAKPVTPADIEAAIKKALGDGDLATEDVPEDEMFSCALGDFDMTKVKSYVAKQAKVTALNVDSIVIAECADGYADEAVGLMNEYYAHTVNYIRQYPFGVPKVEGAKLYKVDNTVMLIIAGASADSEASPEEEAKLAASEYEKIDNALKELFGKLPENLIVIPEQSEDGGSHGGLIGG